MAVTLYRSTDASAPVLDGTAGSLINVLDACLVSGYGAKTAAGWTKPFTAVNKAVFKMGSGVSMYLDVDDSGPGAATTKEARVRGYETMSAVGTGTGPFPTVAQVAGMNARKSVTADATTRPWIVVADDRTFYFFAQTEGTATYWGFSFGEFYSLGGSGDAYRALIMARITENSVIASNDALSQALALNTVTGHYVPRDYTGLGASKNTGKMGGVMGGAVNVSGGFIGGNGSAGLPNLVDGKLYFSPIIVHDTTAISVRGRLRGVYEPEFKSSAFADGDTVAGEGALAGRTLLLIKQFGFSASAAFAIDVTGPWETN